MDPSPRNVESLHSVLRHVAQMGDEELRAHSEVLSLVLSRVTSVIQIHPIPMTKRRSTSAETLLNSVLKNLDSVKRFFRDDQGQLIRAITRNDHGGPNLPEIKGHSLTESKFLCTLYCRHISLGKRRSNRRTNQYFTSAGIPDNDRSRNLLRHGDKILRIEEGTKVPEITLVLAPSYSALEYLFSSEEARLIGLLMHGIYPEITKTARELWGQQKDYQLIFDQQIKQFSKSVSSRLG